MTDLAFALSQIFKIIANNWLNTKLRAILLYNKISRSHIDIITKIPGARFS